MSESSISNDTQNGDHENDESVASDPPISINKEEEEKEEENFKHVESKEDMFVDATDDIEDNQFQEMDNINGYDTPSETTQLDKDTLPDDYKGEREVFAKEVSSLLHQLKNLTGNEDSEEFVGGGSLSEMISECSKCVKISLEQKLHTENMIREFQQQVEELNLKVQAEQNVDVVADRMLGVLSMVVNQEELVDYSVVGKVSHVERSTSLLVEQYRWFLYEVDQLRQCLIEGGFNVGPHEEFGYGSVFSVARSELLELKKTEADMLGKVNYLEDANRKLVEEVEKEKLSVETMNSEIEKVNVELEQEKNRCANAREKLGMAVTKGKALVQQRDSLKLSLAEKTSQLEKCLAELQEKSSADEAAEQYKGELVKCETLVASLQETLSQRNAVFESCMEVVSEAIVPEELQSADITERLKWLVNKIASLQETVLQNNAIFQTFEETFSQISVSEEIESMDMIERLKGLVNLVTSLQEMISQRNKFIISLEEVMLGLNVPEEIQATDAVQKIKWIVEERNALKSNLLEFHRLKDALSLIDLPETASSYDLEARIGWLKDEVKQGKDEINMLQDEIAKSKETAREEIDRLSGMLLAELQEKEYVKMELDELARKYEGVSEEAYQASLEKDQMVRLLLEGSGVEETYSDVATLIERYIGKIKEQRNASSFDASPADAELFERMQNLLYVRDQELMLCEKLLEEDMLVRSDASNLMKELRVASVELASLKEGKDSLQKDLERSEEKNALLREKLSLAVKKGKGLFQDRENLKLTLDEKNSEIEKLKLELQQQESAVTECKDQISRLSADLEKVPTLETDLVDAKNQRDQLEQFLLESNNMLQSVMESIDRIALPGDSVFEEPVEKVNWLAGYTNECLKAKTQAEQELDEVREETNIVASKLAETQEKVKSLEVALSAAENHISQLIEEKREIEVAKENVEQDLQKAKGEADSQTNNFNEACASRKSLEDALSLAENNISLIVKEIEEAQLSRAATETELEKLREEVVIQTEKLTEAYRAIKSLEDALSQAKANVSLLTEQNNQFQVGRIDLENELKRLKEEAESHASRLEDTAITAKQLEDAQLSRGTLETELEKMREEVVVQAEKLTEAYRTIKSLEDALSQAEANVSLLSEENSNFQAKRVYLESELKKMKEEAESQSSSSADTSVFTKQLENSQLSITDREAELEKVRGEVAIQTGKLTEADRTIKSLEDALSQAEANNSLLSEQNGHFQVERSNLENELWKLKEEAELENSRLADTSATVKSLEAALSKKEKDISVLEGEKRIAEQEISTLNSKLKACMDELVGTHGSIEIRSAELIHHLSDLQMLMRNESLLSMVRQHFKKEFENLRSMDAILRDIKGHFVDKVSEIPPSHPIIEEEFHVTKPFPHESGDFANIEKDDDNLRAADVDNISELFKKTIMEFQSRNTNLVGNFDNFSTFIAEFIENLLVKLRATNDAVTNIFDHMESMKQKIKNMEKIKAEQDGTIAMFEKDCRVLLSACTNATNRLQFEVKNNLLDLSSIPELEKVNHGVMQEVTEVDGNDMEHDSRYDNMAETLLLVTGKVRTLIKLFESTSNVAASSIKDLQQKLSESRAAYENVIEERDIIQNRVSELETHVETLQNSCKDFRLKIEDYQTIEEKLKEKEAELLHKNFSKKEQESQDVLMSPSELKALFDKIREVEIPYVESEIGDMESHKSVDVQKLFYIIDSVPELHRQINTLSYDKDELQSTLSRQVLEIEHLQEEIETFIQNNQESERMKTEMSEITQSLEKIVDALGGSEIVGDQKSTGVQRLLPLVEKQIMGLSWEAENSKSQAQELGSRLLASQKVIDDLSTKVKLLEDPSANKTIQPEVVQERSIFEAPPLPTGSEISEIEDAGSVGKNSISPVASAAQLRTMRKGSTDHLVLNVDSESASLINNEETDEDKGHVFKSLNTSGLIPKQGKLLADRIDGIWVSGGRVLMSRPRARLGLVAYLLFLHLWLLGTLV